MQNLIEINDKKWSDWFKKIILQVNFYNSK